ncbi:MAG TPA: hypothetical protein VMU30_12765 [Bacteroidota bacterium]|nr:hypothetical protein [Bacteroidota bacterium]
MDARAQSSNDDSVSYWQLNTAQDHFWEPQCPTSPSIKDGLMLWMLRQKLTVQAYQTILNSEMNLDTKSAEKLQCTNYLPFLNTTDVHSIIGTQFSTYDIDAEQSDSLHKSIQQFWLWTAWQYRYQQWNFSLTTETSWRSDKQNAYSTIGNECMILAYIGYELNPAWDLIFLGGYEQRHMVEK